MNVKLIALLTGAGALGTAVAVAGPQEGGWEAKLEAKFAKIDTDADGSVTEAEYIEYKTAEARASFAEMGGDDGVVTLDEAKAAYAAQEAAKAEKRAEKKAKKKDEGAH